MEMKQHHHTHGQAPKARPVRFELTHPTAGTVYVAGSFNDWQPAQKSLHSAGAGSWLEEISLTPGTYEYCFVVDGEWMADPQAKDSVANPFGGRNSVLVVSESFESEAATARPTGSRKKAFKHHE
ncbi:MAG TPA: glycogen-binding domain-containing protein [Candidatus Limnocylindria bacterium]|jgi:1,4-alpha-glucan branching enzyme|nr:glycogen-binding domain-containing protein [Candidatus Limnocylindria bacterium]